MITIVPARKFCVFENELWFVTRYISLLFKYSFSSKRIEYMGSPAENNVINPYAYSSCFYYDHKILCVPTYEENYCIYSLDTGEFRRIKSNYKNRGVKFDGAVQYKNYVYCFPVHGSCPIVVFDMIAEREIDQINFLSSVDVSKTEISPVTTVVNNKIYGLICPNNTIFELAIDNHSINYRQIDGLYGVVDSVYRTADGVLIHYKNESKVVYLADDSNKVISYEVGASGKTEFAGIINGCVIVDSIDKSKKCMIDPKSGIVDIIDETNNVKKEYRYRTFGTVMNGADGIDYYLSGCSNGVYRFSDNKIVYDSFDLPKETIDQINKSVYESSRNNVIEETPIFGLSEYLRELDY